MRGRLSEEEEERDGGRWRIIRIEKGTVRTVRENSEE